MKKKALSLLLACTMAFSSFSMALAAGDAVVVEATQSNEQMAGDFLKAAGVLKGDDKGNLNLDQALTREQAMLMIAKLMGKEDEALNFKGQSTFKDAKNNAYWAPVIAWAEAQKLTNGMGDGTFGLGKEATKNQVVTMYLRVLGYEVTWAGKELSADSQKVVEETGLLTAVGDTFNRGAMAVMTVNTLKATPKGAETTLAKNLNVDMTKAPKFVTPSVPGEIGEAKVTSVKAVANDKIEVKFDKDVTVSAANFKVTEKADATKAIEVKELTAESTKVVVLTVEALTSGKAYTVKIADQSMNFTGIAKSTIAPTVVNAKGTDFNRVEIEFKAPVDKATAETVANYTIEKATVVKATLSSDRKTVTLETEGLVKNTLYKMTIENVKSVDAVAMKKVTRTFRAIEDVTKPNILSVNYQNNETIIINFSKEMDKATLENVENYKATSTLGNLDIVSAKASASVDGKTNDVVTLKTSTQDVKATYTLTVEGLKDASVKGNALTKFTRTFRGLGVDTIAPVVVGNPEAVNNDLIKLVVSDRNLLDKASVEDPSNYVLDRGLQVVSVELDADTNKYGQEQKTIYIRTSAQEKGNYKLTVKGIMDEFGNALKPLSGTNYRQYGFQWKEVVNAAPAIESVQSNGLEKVVVKLTADANKATAQDPTNYVFNGDLGAATKATLAKDNRTVTLETATQKAGKTYELTINGVEHKYAAIPMVNVKSKFVSTSKEVDLTAPTLSYAYAVNTKEVHIAFSEPMQAPTTTIGAIKAGTINLNYVDKIGDGEILVFATASDLGNTEYTLTNAAVFKDLAGNEFDLSQESAASFRGTTLPSEGPVAAEGDIEQVNARQIKVTFDKNVKIVNDSVTFNTINFKLTHGATKNVVIFTADKAMASNTRLEMRFGTLVTDMVGVKASPNATTTAPESAKVFTTYMAAGESPVLFNVTAIDNKTVELTFSEPLLTNGQYRISTAKDNGDLELFDTPTVEAPDKLSTIQLTLTGNKVLKGDVVYYLTVPVSPTNLDNKRIVDVAKIKEQFNGSDVVPNQSYITVKVINSKEIAAYNQAGSTVTISSIQALDTNNNVIPGNLLESATKDKAIAKQHLVTGTKYRVTAEGKIVDIEGVLASNSNISIEPTTLVKGTLVTVTVSGVNFKEGITKSAFNINEEVVTVGNVARVDDKTVTIQLTATSTTAVTVQAKKAAFEPEASLDGNVVTLNVQLSADAQAVANAKAQILAAGAQTIVAGDNAKDKVAALTTVAGVVVTGQEVITTSALAADKTFTLTKGTETDTVTVSMAVNAAAVDTLTVTTAPVLGTRVTETAIQLATQPVITLKDQYGNICSTGVSASQSVTVAIKGTTTPANAVLAGTTTVNATNGVATFTGLTIAPGTDADITALVLEFTANAKTVDSANLAH